MVTIMAEHRVPFVHEALQWAHDGVTVECFSGKNPDHVIFTGRAIGVMEAPTVVVQLDDGRIRHWALGITRAAEPAPRQCEPARGRHTFPLDSKDQTVGQTCVCGEVQWRKGSPRRETVDWPVDDQGGPTLPVHPGRDVPADPGEASGTGRAPVGSPIVPEPGATHRLEKWADGSWVLVDTGGLDELDNLMALTRKPGDRYRIVRLMDDHQMAVRELQRAADQQRRSWEADQSNEDQAGGEQP